EPRTFFVGPAHELERALRLHAVLIERAEHLEAREHADDAVILSAGYLRVEVTADQHRRQVIVRAGASREDVPDAIDGDRAPGLGAPRHEEIAHLLVGVGEREPPEPAGLARPDLAGAHDGVPEPRAVDLQVRGY